MDNPLPWIQVCPDAPYFMEDTGQAWTPIGFNDAMSWPGLSPLIDRKDVRAGEAYIKMLSEHGITCLRLMMENCDLSGFLLETSVGVSNPRIVQFWDDMFALCEKYNIRLLLTPFDTFWMWLKWEKHPYNAKNGGPVEEIRRFLLDPKAYEVTRQRFDFFIRRYGASGVIFAWDVWNEIHPGYADDTTNRFNEYIKNVSDYISELETELYGRTHLRTVSIFGPLLMEGFVPREGGDPIIDPDMARYVYKNGELDFASAHTYDRNTIDNPKDTIHPAIAMARETLRAISHIRDTRPYFDSEHGPIHLFHNKKTTLPEDFDSEYFRHIAWAHFASGAAGGGMRWPNRHPHTLVPDMYQAMKSMHDFANLIDWVHFRRKNISDKITMAEKNVCCYGCADNNQAILWCIRKDTILPNGMLNQLVDACPVHLTIPGMSPGTYCITFWNTRDGRGIQEYQKVNGEPLRLDVELVSDLAIAIKKEK